jgi:hypothetical protein
MGHGSSVTSGPRLPLHGGFLRGAEGRRHSGGKLTATPLRRDVLGYPGLPLDIATWVGHPVAEWASGSPRLGRPPPLLERDNPYGSRNAAVSEVGGSHLRRRRAARPRFRELASPMRGIVASLRVKPRGRQTIWYACGRPTQPRDRTATATPAQSQLRGRPCPNTPPTPDRADWDSAYPVDPLLNPAAPIVESLKRFAHSASSRS